MGGINIVWLAVWVPSPNWLCHILEECDVFRHLVDAAVPGGGSAGHVPTLHRIPWLLP